jgi:hypothetical protein
MMKQLLLFLTFTQLTGWTFCIAQDRIAISISEHDATLSASDSVPFSKVRWLVASLTKEPNINSFRTIRLSVSQPTLPKEDTPWIQLEWDAKDIRITATGSTRASYLNAITTALADHEIIESRSFRVTVIAPKTEMTKETSRSK